ncbi:Fc receptor-like protein 5 isoform X2 [Myxocyprinus asiaticus]|uniref:Fc receptor-like protein 5 isoform X2 n=1 Tax=Myxocyprinus asiaticus TaxID=70543 RepID=UPI00222303AC|nr:Fc receptor-like protein 5 isoform X2 [Myxocyprinus asiaticus]
MILTLILIGSSISYPRTGAVGTYKLKNPVLIGPSTAMEYSYVTFFCAVPEIPEELGVSYTLYLYQANLKKNLGEYSALSGQEAVFNFPVTIAQDSVLICEASGHNNTDIESTLSNILRLKVISPVEKVSIISHPSTDDLWEGQNLMLHCNITKGTYVLYDWLRNGMEIQMPYDRTADSLTIHRLSGQHTGNYTCVASNQYNNTMIFSAISDIIHVHVKEHLSKPEISLNIVKLAFGEFKAIITCRSEKGTPPNTFRLLNNTKIIATETTHRTSAIFSVPIELNQNMGWVRCNASNEGSLQLSEPISLTVESVGGAVTMIPFKQVGRDFQVYGLVLRCSVERGTFPHYRWFLNKTRLEGRGGFYTVDWTDGSVLSLSVESRSAGFYHCEASDQFDNSTRVISPKMLINKELLNKISTLAVVVVFTSFFLLVIAVTVCCIYGVVLRRRYSRKYPWQQVLEKIILPLSPSITIYRSEILIEQHREMKIKATHEDEEEMVESYGEDTVHADRMSDSAEDEEESIDETLLYEGTTTK